MCISILKIFTNIYLLIKPSVAVFVYPEVKQKQQPTQLDHGSWAFNSGPFYSVYIPGIRVILLTGSSSINSINTGNAV